MGRQQLRLFSVPEPKWENITTEWLLEYLQTEYPEMKFELDEWGYIEQTANKKATCNFKISILDDEFMKSTPWKNNTLILLGFQKKYGSLSGGGQAVNNIEDFKNKLPIYIERCEKHQRDYKDYVKDRKLESEVRV